MEIHIVGKVKVELQSALFPLCKFKAIKKACMHDFTLHWQRDQKNVFVEVRGV